MNFELDGAVSQGVGAILAFIFSFQAATDENKNKLEPDGLSVLACARVLV